MSFLMKNVKISKSVNFSTENVIGVVQTPETHSRPIIRSHFCSKTLFSRNYLSTVISDEKSENMEIGVFFDGKRDWSGADTRNAL